MPTSRNISTSPASSNGGSRPNNVAPIYANNNEEEEEERDEMAMPARRQHKYSTADMEPSRPWKKWLMMGMCCVIVIICMVMFGLLMAWLFNPDEDKEWNSSSNNSTEAAGDGAATGEAGLLPKSSTDLQQLCGSDQVQVQGSSERSVCQDACAPSLNCCDPFATEGDDTCWQDNLSGCVAYSKCHSLTGFFDPAHPDLHRMCSIEAIQANPEECQRACQPVQCCFDPSVDACIATQLSVCLDYLPCQNIKSLIGGSSEQQSFIAVAPVELELQCRRGEATCARSCREATCCSDPASACYRNNFLACLSYIDCNDYPDTTTKIQVAPLYRTVVAAPPIELEQVCAGNKNSTTSAPPTDNSCALACEKAACCFATDNNCFGDDPLGCLEYHACSEDQ